MAMGMVQADSNGDVIRVGLRSQFTEEFRDAPDAADTVLVALEPNEAALREIADDMGAHTIENGVVKKGADTVMFEDGDDSHAAAKFLHGLTTAQRNGLRAGAKAVVTGLDANSKDVEKAIGWLIVQRLEDG